MEYGSMMLPGLTALAFVIFAHGISGKKRRPVLALPALLLVGGVVGYQVMTATGITTTGMQVFRNLGVGAVLGGFYLGRREGKTAMLLVPGILALMGSGAFFAAGTITDALLPPSSPYIHGELLLELGPDDSIDEVGALLEQYDAIYERVFPTISLEQDENLAQYYEIHVADASLMALMAALRKDKENVDQASYNFEMNLFPGEMNSQETMTEVEVLRDGAFLTNDPKATGQWGLIPTEADRLHRLIKDRTPAKKALVAILDTGVDANHEDIKSVFYRSSGNKDRHGHGTHCAGIAGAVTNNQVGMASFNWQGEFVEIAGFQALNANGSGSHQSIAKAIIDATEAGADVISLSLGGWSPIPPKIQVDAINYARNKGVIVVAAAGNSNENANEHAPANIPGVITVSAVNREMQKAPFSNTNTSLAMPIAAPGVDILSLKTGGGYVSFSGTSMATPMVAGLLGVMRALNPDITAEEAWGMLHETGNKVMDSGKVGRVINAPAAIESILN